LPVAFPSCRERKACLISCPSFFVVSPYVFKCQTRKLTCPTTQPENMKQPAHTGRVEHKVRPVNQDKDAGKPGESPQFPRQDTFSVGWGMCRFYSLERRFPADARRGYAVGKRQDLTPFSSRTSPQNLKIPSRFVARVRWIEVLGDHLLRRNTLRYCALRP